MEIVENMEQYGFEVPRFECEIFKEDFANNDECYGVARHNDDWYSITWDINGMVVGVVDWDVINKYSYDILSLTPIKRYEKWQLDLIKARDNSKTIQIKPGRDIEWDDITSTSLENCFDEYCHFSSDRYRIKKDWWLEDGAFPCLMTCETGRFWIAEGYTINMSKQVLFYSLDSAVKRPSEITHGNSRRATDQEIEKFKRGI